MDDVDTGRMKRVLDRLYDRPAEDRGERRPPKTPGDDACGLLRRERELYGLLAEIGRRSGACRGALQGVLRRSGARQRRLRADCFLAPGGEWPEGPPPPRPRTGVLSALGLAVRELEALEEGYAHAGARQPRDRETYGRFARECRSDSETMRALLERAMGS